MVLILEARSHLDLGDLPNLLAAELGVMTVRLERAIRSLDEVAQVHVNRWGDGAAHLHLWFLGRPAGQLQLRGPFLAMWDEILEPVPDAQWRSNLAHIAAWLEAFGGTAQVAPPRIDWHAPSTFAGIAAIEDPAMDATLGAGLATENTPDNAADGTTDGTAVTTPTAAATPAAGADCGPTEEPNAVTTPSTARAKSTPGNKATGGSKPNSNAHATANEANGTRPAEHSGSDHASGVTAAEQPAADGDWTTVDYDESEPATEAAVPIDAEPNPDLASDDSETVSVRISSQPKRPQEERVGR